MAFICETGGATDHEIADGLGMLESTSRARRVELARAGLVSEPGYRRPTPSGRAAVVWVAGELTTANAARLRAEAKGEKAERTAGDDKPLHLPIIASAQTVRRILAGEPVTIWVREKFSTRADGERIRIRYPAGPEDAVKVVEREGKSPCYATAKHVSHAGRHMPRWACRLRLTAQLESDRE